MDRLWAPWRSKYIWNKKKRKCIFCIPKDTKCDAKRYILKRGAYAFSMLNAYPYNNGHVMVAPYRHVRDMARLSGDEISELMALVIDMKSRIEKRFKPHGYNIGINMGKVSCAGFDGHIHVHIVPRWNGDTNFMPVTAETKVVSDSLKEAYKILKKDARVYYAKA